MKWLSINCIKKSIPFTSKTNEELEKIYNGNHITPFKTKGIQTFTNPPKNLINGGVE